jgi:hypothetical protein
MVYVLWLKIIWLIDIEGGALIPGRCEQKVFMTAEFKCKEVLRSAEPGVKLISDE